MHEVTTKLHQSFILTHALLPITLLDFWNEYRTLQALPFSAKYDPQLKRASEALKDLAWKQQPLRTRPSETTPPANNCRKGISRHTQ